MILLPQNVAHVFLLDYRTIDDAKLEEYQKPLSDDELTRIDDFSDLDLRRKQLITRMAVRSCLSLYSDGISPKDWTFAQGDKGKPQVADDAPMALSFNLSHSGEWLAVAVTVDADIGIDLQQRNHRQSVTALAERFFHPDEARELAEMAETRQREQFFRLWTLKEAYLKACGQGIARGLEKVRFHLDNNGLITTEFDSALGDDPSQWQFHHYDLDDEYCLSLAMKQPRAQDASPHFYKIIPGDLLEPLELLAHEIVIE